MACEVTLVRLSALVDCLSEESLLELGYGLRRSPCTGEFARLNNSLLVFSVLFTLLVHQDRSLIVRDGHLADPAEMDLICWIVASKLFLSGLIVAPNDFLHFVVVLHYNWLY